MEVIYIFCFSIIALCSAVEDTQDRDQVGFPEDLQDFIRRLTQQQRQTTQNFQPALLPQLNRAQLRPRIEGEPVGAADSPIPYLKFPFQSSFGNDGGSRSYASSSVTVKRPQTGTNVEAQAAAYASVKDVNDEEHMGERLDSDAKSSSGKDSTSSEYQKSSTLEERILATVDDDESTKKGEPFALKHQQVETVIKAEDSFSDVYFVAIVAGCCAVGIFGVISAGICFYKLQKSRKAAADVDYPAYGVTGPNKDVSSPNGDRKLAQSAQMYHYQHQKQQMIAVEKAGSTKNASASDVDSEEENEEGDYTVYECPGLAPTGEMEVKNPLFHDDTTPVSPPVQNSKSDSNHNN